MRFLALIGSPRKGGKTDLMADAVLEGASLAGADTSKVYLDDVRIRPIAEVVDRSSEREDPRRDDDFPAVLEMFMSADVIVWSTPVYWQAVSAQMKCFQDRMSSYFNRAEYRERFRGKGHLVVTAYGSADPGHAAWVTGPLQVTAQVLRGRYLGDVHVTANRKGAVQDMPDILAACRALGAGAVREMARGGADD